VAELLHNNAQGFMMLQQKNGVAAKIQTQEK